MNTTVHKNLVVLARVLERLERSCVPVDAEQYRAVVNHLASEFASVAPDAALEAVLESFPAAAELYENLNYAHAGLCRTALEPALAAELQARKLIAAVRSRAAQPPYD
jgi:hemoglobin-like flavoprotein